MGLKLRRRVNLALNEICLEKVFASGELLAPSIKPANPVKNVVKMSLLTKRMRRLEIILATGS